MNITPELILAAAALLTALGTLLTQRRAGRTQEKKDEVFLLRDEVTRLQARVEVLEKGYDREQRNNATLMSYVSRLRSIMIEAKMTVPEMPVLEA